MDRTRTSAAHCGEPREHRRIAWTNRGPTGTTGVNPRTRAVGHFPARTRQL